MEEKIFIRIPNIYFEDLRNWSRPEDKCSPKQITTNSRHLIYTSPLKDDSQKGEKSVHVRCNDTSIALFRVDDKVYAVQGQCPHAGGPLHLGDIEELPGEGLCVKCPWHSWRVHLSTGAVKLPKGRKESAAVFPVKVESDGSIFIGFDKFSDTFFDTDRNF